MATRYFIGVDDSCHYYLVPVEHRAEWNDWADYQLPDEYTDAQASYAWTTPSYARRIDRYSSITFTDPQEH